MPATRAVYKTLSRILHRHLLPLICAVPPLEAVAYRVYVATRDHVPGKERDLRDVPNPLQARGLTLWHDGRRSYTVYGIARGWHERSTTALVLRLLRPGGQFVDLGAHIGWYTLLAARAVGDAGHVWAFEPEPATYALLEQNIAENGLGDRVGAFPVAVTDASGHARLTTYCEDSGSASTFDRPLTRASEHLVPTTSLDTWAESAGWPAIDLIKIDVEGAEVKVLQGMRRLAAALPGLRVIVEFQAETLKAAGNHPDDLFEALKSCGFNRVEAIGRRLEVVESKRQRARLTRRARWVPINLLATRAR